MIKIIMRMASKLIVQNNDASFVKYLQTALAKCLKLLGAVGVETVEVLG